MYGPRCIENTDLGIIGILKKTHSPYLEHPSSSSQLLKSKGDKIDLRGTPLAGR